MTEPTEQRNDLEVAAEEMRQESVRALRKRIDLAQSPPHFHTQEFSLPGRYRGKRLIDLDQRYKAKIQAALKATRAGHNVLIFGGIGSGKTHLAVCLLWERWKSLVTVGLDIWNEAAVLTHPEKGMRFRSTSEIVGELKAAKATWKREDEIIDAHVRNEVLVLDDLGFEERSETVRNWLSTLLDRRYQAMRQTIITTNLDPKDLSDAVDDRITSRLIENGIMIHMDGHDYRRKIAEDNKRNIYTRDSD